MSKSKNVILAEAQAAWDASPALRAEFGGDFASYCAYCQATNRGRVKMFGTNGSHRYTQADAPPANAAPAARKSATRAQWDASPDLRAEFFDNFEVFAAYSRAVAKGDFKDPLPGPAANPPANASRTVAPRVLRVRDEATGQFSSVPIPSNQR